MTLQGKYYFNPIYKNYNDDDIWFLIVRYIDKNNSFYSVSKIRYNAQIENDILLYIGGKSGSKREMREYSFEKEGFLEAYNSIIKYDYINSTVLGNKYRKSEIFMWQSAALLGLLYTVGIIQNIKIKPVVPNRDAKEFIDSLFKSPDDLNAIKAVATTAYKALEAIHNESANVSDIDIDTLMNETNLLYESSIQDADVIGDLLTSFISNYDNATIDCSM